MPRFTRNCHRYNAIKLENALSQEITASGAVITKVAGKTIAANVARFHRYGNDAT